MFVVVKQKSYYHINLLSQKNNKFLDQKRAFIGEKTAAELTAAASNQRENNLFRKLQINRKLFSKTTDN
jgi:hypothetical protein